jgi:outer membrane protein OmpA-like peptidoglycan-associated protein
MLAGCGGALLEKRAGAVRDLVATARENGAMRCAPVELAMAVSHVDFAEQELAEGRYYAARGELGVAERNARKAVRKSPREKCAPTVVVDEPRPKITVKRKDTDGDGLFDDEDECPKQAEDKDGFQDDDGCPDEDNDNDGLADRLDDCRDDPEDKDGFEDDDGCPDADNDKDGLADKIDQCPNDPEDADAFEDDDGCPDCDNDKDGVPECPKVVDLCPAQPAETPDGCPQRYKLVVVRESHIELKQTVYFDTGKATIRAVSYALLNEVGEALEDHATLHVRIEGHTDSRGQNDYNLRLSQARAESVRDYLVARGIDHARMEPKGYGEEVPLADNRTKAGRDQNRRVEFVITSR